MQRRCEIIGPYADNGGCEANPAPSHSAQPLPRVYNGGGHALAVDCVKKKKSKVGSFVHSCREMRSNSRHRNAIRETDVRVPDDFEYILTKYIYIPKQLQIKLVMRLCICGFHCAFMSCPDPPTEQNIGATQHKVPNGVKRISLHQCTNPSNAVAEEGLKLRYGEVCNIDMNGNNVW